MSSKTAGSFEMIVIGTSRSGVGAAHDPCRLVVAEHDEHEVRLVVGVQEREHRAEGVLHRLSVRRPAPAAGRPTPRSAPVPRPAAGRTPSRRPTSDHGTRRGTGVHGVCDDTKSISAITGACVAGELALVEALPGVLVGHARVAERRPPVAHVAGVEHGVVAVERRAQPPTARCWRARPRPCASRRRRTRGVSVSRSLAVSRSYFCCESTHTPLCSVACASQLTPPNVGEVRNALCAE